MKVLVVDGFDSSARGRSQFNDFFRGVKYAFRETCNAEVPLASGLPHQFDVEPLDQLFKYVYAYERNEYTDPAAIALFDKVDCIFVDCDRRLMPWGKKTRALLLLLKTAFFTRKCVFAAGGAMQLVAFVLSTGGKRVRVLNGQSGGKRSDMEKFTVPSIVGPDDVYLDSESGDFYGLAEQDGLYQWVPQGNVGCHLHDTTAHLKMRKFGVKPSSPRKRNFAPPPHKAVPMYPVKAIMAGEVKVRVERESLSHPAFRGFGENGSSFLTSCDNAWNVDLATNKRNAHQYKVLASSDRGPQVITYKDIWSCQFHVRQKFPCSYEIMKNYVAHIHKEICKRGKIGISCEFLKNGDPNLKPKRSLMRPFSAPVRRSSTTSAMSGIGGQGRGGSARGSKTLSARGKLNETQQQLLARQSRKDRRGSTATQVDSFDATALVTEGE